MRISYTSVFVEEQGATGSFLAEAPGFVGYSSVVLGSSRIGLQRAK